MQLVILLSPPAVAKPSRTKTPPMRLIQSIVSQNPAFAETEVGQCAAFCRTADDHVVAEGEA